mmetsp:Transcript_31643/g.87359  ORF Transcript_31643/g.87359 Transcript_31643/m.87359 type:complete len:1040 (-) Transcript_31643:111-3230(-)
MVAHGGAGGSSRMASTIEEREVETNQAQPVPQNASPQRSTRWGDMFAEEPMDDLNEEELARWCFGPKTFEADAAAGVGSSAAVCGTQLESPGYETKLWSCVTCTTLNHVDIKCCLACSACRGEPVRAFSPDGYDGVAATPSQASSRVAAVTRVPDSADACAEGDRGAGNDWADDKTGHLAPEEGEDPLRMVIGRWRDHAGLTHEVVPDDQHGKMIDSCTVSTRKHCGEMKVAPAYIRLASSGRICFGARNELHRSRSTQNTLHWVSISWTRPGPGFTWTRCGGVSNEGQETSRSADPPRSRMLIGREPLLSPHLCMLEARGSRLSNAKLDPASFQTWEVGYAAIMALVRPTSFKWPQGVKVSVLAGGDALHIDSDVQMAIDQQAEKYMAEQEARARALAIEAVLWNNIRTTLPGMRWDLSTGPYRRHVAEWSATSQRVDEIVGAATPGSFVLVLENGDDGFAYDDLVRWGKNQELKPRQVFVVFAVRGTTASTATTSLTRSVANRFEAKVGKNCVLRVSLGVTNIHSTDIAAFLGVEQSVGRLAYAVAGAEMACRSGGGMGCAVTPKADVSPSVPPTIEEVPPAPKQVLRPLQDLMREYQERQKRTMGSERNLVHVESQAKYSKSDDDQATSDDNSTSTFPDVPGGAPTGVSAACVQGMAKSGTSPLRNAVWRRRLGPPPEKEPPPPPVVGTPPSFTSPCSDVMQGLAASSKSLAKESKATVADEATTVVRSEAAELAPPQPPLSEQRDAEPLAEQRPRKSGGGAKKAGGTACPEESSDSRKVRSKAPAAAVKDRTRRASPPRGNKVEEDFNAAFKSAIVTSQMAETSKRIKGKAKGKPKASSPLRAWIAGAVQGACQRGQATASSAKAAVQTCRNNPWTMCSLLVLALLLYLMRCLHLVQLPDAYDHERALQQENSAAYRQILAGIDLTDFVTEAEVAEVAYSLPLGARDFFQQILAEDKGSHRSSDKVFAAYMLALSQTGTTPPSWDVGASAPGAKHETDGHCEAWTELQRLRDAFTGHPKKRAKWPLCKKKPRKPL